MNTPRRKAIKSISLELEKLRGRIEAILKEEQAYFDSMPESDKDYLEGDLAQEAVHALHGACNEVKNAVSYLDTAAE